MISFDRRREKEEKEEKEEEDVRGKVDKKRLLYKIN